MKNKSVVFSIFTLVISIICTCVTLGAIFVLDSKLDLANCEENIYNESLSSVVELKAVTNSIGESYGSAFFVSESGHLVTNAHVVTFNRSGQIIAFDEFYIRFAFEEIYRPATLIKFDSTIDIAYLKLDEVNCKFKKVVIGNSDKIKTGQKIYAIGNLNKVGLSITQGSISNANIIVEYNNVDRSVIQCDLTIAEGNSGGVLLDNKGRVIGVTTFRLKDTSNNVIYGISYCVPINTVLDYIKEK